MSKAEDLLSQLLVARTGVNTGERQAQSRIKTRDYLDRGKKELKGENVLSIIKETETEIGALRTSALAEKDDNLVEVYDAALSVFSTWNHAREA
ncbi:hypothetical protein [Telmatospirillum siberiense]|uniref:Uncharacterized protein n=1 Tax=Telmatospirillum siberiense TaxID=382514 RepID=A0A2N3PZK5_9PROT|nr:hypothetical protein [Telmatospirillum siberiense]PKU25825.1 hypothetical protein CWS72_04505 [Telmatospirillum siberiense]